MGKFFIVCNYQKREDGVFIITDDDDFIITDDDDSVKLFDTEDGARKAAKNNMHCSHFGYEIFELETGES